MNVDRREVRRRAWCIVGRWLWDEVAAPLLMILAGVVLIVLCALAWSYHPLLVLVPMATALVGLIGPLVWDNAKDKARDDLAREHRIGLREIRRR